MTTIHQQNTFQLPPYINKIPSNYHHTSTKYLPMTTIHQQNTFQCSIHQQNTFQWPLYINKIHSNDHHTSTKYYHIVPNKLPPYINKIHHIVLVKIPTYIHKIPSYCSRQNTHIHPQNTIMFFPTKYHHTQQINKIPSYCFLQNTQSQNTLLHSSTPSCCEPLVVVTFPSCREKTTHPQKSLSNIYR
jgi:hypothetical protein